MHLSTGTRHTTVDVNGGLILLPYEEIQLINTSQPCCLFAWEWVLLGTMNCSGGATAKHAAFILGGWYPAVNVKTTH